jgi:hypothetical protein
VNIKPKFENNSLIYINKPINHQQHSFEEVNIEESLIFIIENFTIIKNKLIKDGFFNKELNFLILEGINEIKFSRVKNKKIKFNINIKRGSIIQGVDFKNNNIKKVLIENCNFQNNLFEDNNIDILSIDNCNINGLNKIGNIKTIKINNSNNINTIFRSDKNTLSNIYIEGGNSIGDIDINLEKNNNYFISIKKHIFDSSLKIHSTNKKSTSIYEDSYGTNHLSISNVSNVELFDNNIKNELEIENIIYDKLKIINNKFEKIKIKDSKNQHEYSNLILKDLDFENSELINFYFPKETEISNCFLNNIKYTNVEWCEEIINENKKNKKDIYRQLKLICEENKDKVNVLKFDSKEMEVYEKILIDEMKDNYNKYNSIMIVFFSIFFFLIYTLIDNLMYKQVVYLILIVISIGIYLNNLKGFKTHKILGLWNPLFNLVSLYFNKISNHYGQIWILPIFWIFFINFSFSVFFLGDNVIYNFLLLFNVKSFFISSSETFNITMNYTMLTFDILRRITVALLIYQTVQAFRKYSRKL